VKFSGGWGLQYDAYGGGLRLDIVNAALPVTSIRRFALSDIFLKKTTRWPGGQAAVPADQSAVSGIRAAFTKRVHERSVEAVQNCWQQQIFSGRDTPPHVKVSDSEAMAFVATTPGAVASPKRWRWSMA